MGNVTKLEFEDFEFFDENEKNRIKVVFLRHYYFYIDKKDLEKLSFLKTEKNSISFKNSNSEKGFRVLLSRGFENLINSVTGRKTVYIHRNSGIPLIGTNEFGIVDRNTNLIEVKPLTGCNLNCIFCSIGEGRIGETNKTTDFVVEKDYLVEEFKKIAAGKRNPVEAHIGPQGEPLLYKEFVELVKGLKSVKNIEVISMDTNGLLLSEKLIDELASVGLSRINLSLNALDKKLCDKLSNRNYNLKHILRIIKYSEGKIDILVAPVIVPGINEDQIDALIELCLKITLKENSQFPRIGFQNFLNYPHGRNPAKAMEWDKFYTLLKNYEKKHNINLLLTPEMFNIKKDTQLEKPFKKGDVVRAEIKCNGRHIGERIAVYKNRCITIANCSDECKSGKIVKVRIVRDKHNVFKGICI